MVTKNARKISALSCKRLRAYEKKMLASNGPLGIIFFFSGIEKSVSMVQRHGLELTLQHAELNSLNFSMFQANSQLKSLYFLHYRQTLSYIQGAQWLSCRVLDSRQKGSGFQPHRRHCGVFSSKTLILA